MGFFDYLRMAMGWWSSPPVVVRDPIVGVSSRLKVTNTVSSRLACTNTVTSRLKVTTEE